MGWHDVIVSMDGRLKGRDRISRALLFHLACGCFVLTAAVVATGNTDNRSELYTIMCCILLVTCGSIIALCLCRVNITKRMTKAYVLAWTFSIVLLNIQAAARSAAPSWGTFVMVLDLSLVLRLGRSFALYLLVAVSLWIALLQAEVGIRFGLLDMPGTADMELRRAGADHACSCTDPPCPHGGWAAFDGLAALMVLVVDFLATRGFADAAENEQASMAHTIETVEAAAQLLAGYDVDTVAVLLEAAEGRLPPAMHAALQRLEQNLRLYRPYLPKSCLPWRGFEGSASSDTSSKTSSVMAASLSLSLREASRVLRYNKASVSVMNVCGSLGLLESSAVEFAHVFDSVLTVALSVTQRHRGLVDVFVGDRVLASFNTWRPCAVHAASAVQTAQDIVHAVGSLACGPQGVRVSIGLATGRVLHGDVGCADMRRFSVLGAVPLVACGMERAARAFMLPVMCNRNLQQDTELEHVLLLVPRLVHLVKAGACGGDKLRDAVPDSGEQPVYEVCIPGAADKTHVADEWLYQIGRGAAEWAPYNDAVRKYLKGAGVADAASEAGQHEAAVRHSLAELGSRTPLLLCV